MDWKRNWLCWQNRYKTITCYFLWAKPGNTSGCKAAASAVAKLLVFTKNAHWKHKRVKWLDTTFTPKTLLLSMQNPSVSDLQISKNNYGTHVARYRTLSASNLCQSAPPRSRSRNDWNVRVFVICEKLSKSPERKTSRAVRVLSGKIWDRCK